MTAFNSSIPLDFLCDFSAVCLPACHRVSVRRLSSVRPSPSGFLSLSVSISPSVCHSLSPCDCLSFSVCLSLSICLSHFRPSVYISYTVCPVCASVRPSVCLSFCLCVTLKQMSLVMVFQTSSIYIAPTFNAPSLLHCSVRCSGGSPLFLERFPQLNHRRKNWDPGRQPLPVQEEATVLSR